MGRTALLSVVLAVALQAVLASPQYGAGPSRPQKQWTTTPFPDELPPSNNDVYQPPPPQQPQPQYQPQPTSQGGNYWWASGSRPFSAESTGQASAPQAPPPAVSAGNPFLSGGRPQQPKPQPQPQQPSGGGGYGSAPSGPPQTPAYDIPCSQPGQVCVGLGQCQGGYVAPGANGIRQGQCSSASQTCCQQRPQQPQYQPPPPPPQTSGYGQAQIPRPQPPPPSYGGAGGYSQPQPSYQPQPTPGPYTGPLNTTPYPGCAAALKCVEEVYCTAEGVMADTPQYLSREQQENRVPMSDCQNPETGIIGKCCRDPNYKDPWPGGMMMKNMPTAPSGPAAPPPPPPPARGAPPPRPFQDTCANSGGVCVASQQCPAQSRMQPEQGCSMAGGATGGVCCEEAAPYREGQDEEPTTNPNLTKEANLYYQAPSKPAAPRPVVSGLPQSPAPRPANGAGYGQSLGQPAPLPPVPPQPTNYIQPPFQANPSPFPQPSQTPQPTVLPAPSPSYAPQPPPQKPAPQPTYAPQPSPQPAPQPTYAPQPQPQPAPQPTYAPQPPSPQPAPQPTYAPQPPPQPAPQPTYAPQPSPQPAPQPTYAPQPPPQPAPQPTYKPQPAPQSAPPPTYRPQPSPQPSYNAQPAAQPTYNPQPAAQPTYNSQPKYNPQPALKPTFAPQPSPQPALQPTYAPQPPAQPTYAPQPPPQASPQTTYPSQPSPPPTYSPQPPSYAPQPAPAQPQPLERTPQPEAAPAAPAAPTQASYGPQSAEACGQRRQVPRPEGLSPGQAAPGEYPWQAIVASRADRNPICGAAVLSKDAVITAAHCVHGMEASDLMVIAGEHLMGVPEPGAQESSVAAVARHPNFDPASLFNDHAVLRLAEPFVLGERVATVCLPEGSEPERSAGANLAGSGPRQDCVATGWGLKALKGNNVGSGLNAVPARLMAPEEAERHLRRTFLGPNFRMHSSQVCALASKPDTNLCMVDPGGPLVCPKPNGAMVLAGVYSWDVGCHPSMVSSPEGPMSPTAFSAVDADWVRRVVAEPIQSLVQESRNEVLRKQQQEKQPDRPKPGFDQGYGK